MYKSGTKQHLKQYLDDQIANFHSSPTAKPSFDNIQAKLQKIQQKLLRLKSQSEPKYKYSQAQQTSSIRVSANHSHNKYYVQSTPPRKQQAGTIQKAEKQIQTETPPKQLNLVSKIMSQGHLFRKSLIDTVQKKSTKKPQTTIKKKDLTQGVGMGKFFERQKNQTKKSSKKSVKGLNKSANAASNCQIKLLQRQIQQSWRSNTELRRKVDQLRSYETQYWKLKQIFDKCQKLRRNRKKQDTK